MGGGIGQWLLFRAADRSLSLFSLVVPSGAADAGPRPPRLGARRPLPRHPGRGDLRRHGRRARPARAPRARPRRLLRADPADRRHPPGAHDVGRDLGLDPPAHQRHRLRLAPRLRPRVRRADAVSLRLCERRVRDRLTDELLPPGPRDPPVLQTLRWLIRPIAFLEDCRRRYGDAFSVQLLGFETPLVMVSSPEAIRALYTRARHGLPPGRDALAASRSSARARCCCSRAPSTCRGAG